MHPWSKFGDDISKTERVISGQNFALWLCKEKKKANTHFPATTTVVLFIRDTTPRYISADLGLAILLCLFTFLVLVHVLFALEPQNSDTS